MGNQPPSINLLRKQESIIGRFIRWALTVGRLLVIITELVALSAFIYRFSLDSQLVDLRGKITQKQNIIRLLQKNEETYRNLQDRLFASAKLESQTEKITKTFLDVINLAPQDLALHNLSISQNSITIEATTQSAFSLKNYIDSLKNYPGVKSFIVSKIENKISSATLGVSMQVQMK